VLLALLRRSFDSVPSRAFENCSTSCHTLAGNGAAFGVLAQLMAMSRRVSGGGRRVWVGKESGAKYAPVSIWATFGHLPQRQWEGQHHRWHAALALERLRPLQITQGRLTDERTDLTKSSAALASALTSHACAPLSRVSRLSTPSSRPTPAVPVRFQGLS